MDPNGGLFSALPAELIIIILSSLDLCSLLRCRQLNHLFNDLYESSASLQYKVELAVSGMQNGPPSTVAPAARLRKLRNYQELWKIQEWTRDENIVMSGEGNVWELSGGVLAQHRKTDNTVVLWQLPSVIRDIEGKSWTVPLHGFNLRDLALDPAQDVLVLIENITVPQGINGSRIHLRTLSTGDAHPLASNPPVITHMLDTVESDLHYCIQIFADYVGILFELERVNELVILNWKTGRMKLRLRNLTSFAFLTERHILLAMSMGPCLQVIDFSSPASQTVLPDVVCSFSYPIFAPHYHITSITIRSDPAPSWTPNNQLKVPFSVANDNRLFVISLLILYWSEPVILFVPLSTFVSHISTVDEGQEGRVFKWEEWGPSGSRMMNLWPISAVWVCYVFGTKFVTIEENEDYDGESDERLVVSIYDFNQLAYRREFDRTRGGQFTSTEFVSADMPDYCELPQVDVPTNLPYRKWTTSLEKLPAADAIMCSEDNIIIVAVCTLPKVLHSILTEAT